MGLEFITLLLSCLALIVAVVAAAFSFLSYANVVGLKNSTHQVVYGNLPVDKENPTGDELVKEFHDKMYPFHKTEEEQI